MNFWQKWKYPYLSIIAISVVIAISLAGNESFKSWVLQLGSMEYVGALLAGLLFVSSVTVPISFVVIGILSQDIHPVALALIGGVGAMFGDLLILRFIRSHLAEELAELVGKKETSHIRLLLKSRYISWTLPILGMFVIASPLPDELGVSLLGMSNISEGRFMLISYISNAFGILAVASVARIL